jgi:hypothetical protein
MHVHGPRSLSTLQTQSFLEIKDSTARFHGTLDIETLGGAGFASQRTTGDDREWDLSDYAGIQLKFAEGDSMSQVEVLQTEFRALMINL